MTDSNIIQSYFTRFIQDSNEGPVKRKLMRQTESHETAFKLFLLKQRIYKRSNCRAFSKNN